MIRVTRRFCMKAQAFGYVKFQVTTIWLLFIPVFIKYDIIGQN